MTIWGKLYRLLTERRCAWCNEPRARRGECTRECAALTEQAAIW